MNIKEYISSGIIESYVLGLASPEERAEFEALCAQHPELVAARNEFELLLEKQLLDEAVNPPAGLKEQLMRSIRQDIPGGQSKVISMPSTDTSRRSGMLRYVAAASVILLLVAAYFAYNFYDKNKKLNDTVNNQQVEIETMKEIQRMMTSPTVNVVSLEPTTQAKASADVYWDSTSADVYMVVKNLPQLPNDKQYQLWSIINDANGGMQPNSMGLFDVSEGQKVILKMPKVTKADAFAITIENRGNTGGPNLEQLQTMGKTRVQ